MQWIVEAHEELTKKPVPKIDVFYSKRFKGLNANVHYKKDWMEFRLSSDWKEVDQEIKKGLIQHLLCKIYGIKKRTLNIELYEGFLKQASEYTIPGESDEQLLERFTIINDEYFAGMMNQPTLEWGNFSTTRLGTYDYASDTIRISTAMKEDIDMLDYVLYHEMLHKKHKFTCTGGRTNHHTKQFKQDEKKFRVPQAEKQLENYLRVQRRKKPRKKRKNWFF